MKSVSETCIQISDTFSVAHTTFKRSSLVAKDFGERFTLLSVASSEFRP